MSRAKVRPRRLKPKRLTREQFIAFSREVDKIADPYKRSLLRALLYTGARVGELCELKWENVDFDEGVIRITNAKWGSDRLVPIHPKLRRDLLDYRRRTEGEGYVWPARKRRGEHVNRATVHRWVKAIARRLGLPWVHAHTFRHTWISLQLDQGVPLHVVADLAGHRRFETTRVYARGTAREYREAVRGLP